MRKEKPYWCRKARSEMILRDISTQDMADALGVTKSYVSAVLNGTVVALAMIDAISDYLNISNDYYADNYDGKSQITEERVTV